MRNLAQQFFIWYFTQIAKILIARYEPTVITITGSVGKTTTKDVLIAQLKTVTTVGGTIRSQNSDIGTPLSILGIEVKNAERSVLVWLRHMGSAFRKLFTYTLPKVLVIEVGAGGPGDISSIASWLKADYAVFTALAKNPVHVDHFNNDRQMLFDEKKQLALLSKKTATIIYPKKDEFLSQLLSDVDRRKIELDQDMVTDSKFTISGTVVGFAGGDSVSINGVWSNVITQSYLVGLEIVKDLGLTVSEVHENFSKYYVPTPGRARLLQGINQSIVVDDSYNASPIAVDALLDMAKSIELEGRKIFIFGDMKELGTFSEQAHVHVGRRAFEEVDLLITVGEDSLSTFNTVINMGWDHDQAVHFTNSNDAGQWLSQKLIPGDLVLAKSSRHAIRMEQALSQIVTEDNKKYLVQEYL